MFLKTFLLFWPLRESNTSLTIIFDDEKKNEKYFEIINKSLNYSKTQITGGLNIYYNNNNNKNFSSNSFVLNWHDRFLFLLL